MPSTLILLRILWEDDRYGRVALMRERDTCARTVAVEVPAGRTAAGEVIWQPLTELHGVDSDAAQALLALVHELAGDICYYTRPLHAMDPFFAAED